MAVIHHVITDLRFPEGRRLLVGKLDIGAYAAGGATLNLANYFEDDAVPSLMLLPDIQAANAGFGLGANISNGELIAIRVLVPIQSNADTAVDYLGEANVGMRLGANVEFWAIGQSR